ncbi:MAG: YraN family protein [Clostridia bacterium]|nr:YraN family protein [Clostridia bacterium]
MKTNKSIGDFGESLAEKYLKRKGWHILSRNFLVRGGEIDVIGYRNGILVFFEVKTRSSESFGRPSDAVDGKKVESIKRASAEFLKCYGRGGRISVFYPFGTEIKRRIRKTRIDVIEIFLGGEELRINHIKDWENRL